MTKNCSSFNSNRIYFAQIYINSDNYTYKLYSEQEDSTSGTDSCAKQRNNNIKNESEVSKSGTCVT